MPQGLLVEQRQFYRVQSMEKQEEVDRRRGGKAILKIGQGWTLPAQQGQLKTGQEWKGIIVKSSVAP